MGKGTVWGAVGGRRKVGLFVETLLHPTTSEP